MTVTRDGVSPERRANPSLSVVLPMHNEERGLDRLFARLLPVLRGLGLSFEIVAVDDGEPLILTVVGDEEAGEGAHEAAALPFGPFDPFRHRTLEIGLRAWVEQQTALRLGYVEQLYTFGDRGRYARPGDEGPHVVSVGYLALTRIVDRGEGGEGRGEIGRAHV